MFWITKYNVNSGKIKANTLAKSKIKIYTNRTIKIKENNKCIILKHLDINILKKVEELKKNNMIIYYEPLDFMWNKFDTIENYLDAMHPIFENFNGIILPSKHMMDLIRNRFSNIKYEILCNYHEYDERLIKKERIDQIYYIGIIQKLSLTKKEILEHNIKLVNCDSKLKNTNINSSIQIDFINKDTTYYHLHTSTKLSTALMCNSIFLCNRVPVYVELLGDDYEFYINDNKDNLKDIIEKAKVFDRDSYITKYAHIKKLLCPSNISHIYETLVSSRTPNFNKW